MASTELTEPVGESKRCLIFKISAILCLSQGYSDSRYPLKVNLYCVHCGHFFPVGNKTLHTLKGVYIVDTLKLGVL